MELLAKMGSMLRRRAGLLLGSLAALFLFANASAAEEAIRLPPVIVTATSTEQAPAEVPASVSVVTGEELRQRPVQDLSDALRGVPGVTLSSVGLGRRGISIRGNRPDHTLVLVDGKRINAAADAIAHADFDLDWVPAEAIERIEVVRGPLSSLYGSEALGGVVNIITRKATDTWQGSLDLNGGVPDHGRGGETYQLGLYASGPLIADVLGLSLWAETHGREELTDRFDARSSSLDQRQAFSGSATLSWAPDARQRIDLGYSAGHQERWRDALTSGPQPAVYRTEDEIRRRQLSLSHVGDWDWGTSRLRAYRSELERENERSDQPVRDRPQKLTDSVIDGAAFVPLGEHHRLGMGGEIRREELKDQTVAASGRAGQTHYATFVQDEILLGEQWSLVLGSRFDRHEEYGTQASPRAYLVYHRSESLIFKGGVSRGFKAPTLKQLSPEYQAVGGGGRFTIVGNPDLEPETSTSYEAGFEYTQAGWSARAMLFQNDLDDLIQTVCVASCGVRGAELRNYTNVDRARIRGLELGGGLALPLDLRLQLNYTYLDPRDLSNGRRLADRSRHAGAARLSWTPTAAFDAQLRAEYIGTQSVWSGNTEQRRPGYSLWSVDLSYRLSERVSLRAGVENLTDERLADADAIYPIADPGRVYHAGVRVSL